MKDELRPHCQTVALLLVCSVEVLLCVLGCPGPLRPGACTKRNVTQVTPNNVSFRQTQCFYFPV